jgi:hypothetical protein
MKGSMKEGKWNMPAIASLEDLKAAQKEGVSIYAMLYALPVLRSPARRDVGGCTMLYGNGAR